MALNEYDELLSGEKVPEGNEYDAALNEERDSQRTALKQSMFVAAQAEPERKAQVLGLSKQLNLPAGVIERNFDEVSRRAQSATADYDQIIEKTPGLAKWLEDPDNATLGKDDLDQLGRIDHHARRIRPKKSEPFFAFGESNLDRAARTGFNQLESSGWAMAAAYGLTTPQEAAQRAADANKRAQELRARMPNYAVEFNATMEREGKDIDKAFNQFLSSYHSARKGHIKQALVDFLAGGGKTVGETLDMVVAAGTRPRGLTYATVENLASSAPGIAAGAAGTAAGGPGGMVVGAFVGGVATEVGAQINDSLQKRGVDVTNPEALAQAYADPKLMAEVRAEAQRKGITTAGVDAIFTAVAGKGLAKARKSGAGAASRITAVAKDVGVQAAGEATSEFAGQLAREKGDLSKVNLAEAIQEGIISLGHSAGETAIGASARTKYSRDPVEAAGELAERTRDALETQNRAQSLVEIGAAVKESKLTKRMPEKLRELVDLMNDGDEPAAVYFQPNDWDSYWTRKGLSPARAAEQIIGDSGKAYFEAKETGSALEIPLGTFIEKVAPTEDYDGLLPSTRTSPDGMSIAEAQEHMQSLGATMEELAREASGQPTVDEAPQAESAQAIAEDVSAQLESIGFDRKTARTYSAVYEAAFRSLGERLGVDPKSLFDQYGLRINRPDQAPSGEQVLEQPARAIIFPVRQRENSLSVDAAEGMNASGRIVGSTFQVESLRSNPKYQGVTQDMIRSLERAARARGAESMAADMAGLSDDAISAYEAQGFLPQDGKLVKELMRETVLNQDAVPVPEIASTFYLKSQQLIEAKMGNSATVEQVRAILKEVKEEERKWSGIDEFLKGKEKISKAELLEFLRANQLEIKEVTKGGSGNAASDEARQRLLEWAQSKDDEDLIAAAERAADGDQSALSRLEEDGLPRDIMENLTGSQGGSATKFQSYTLPGGENYREVLFTLPGRGLPQGYVTRQNKNGRWEVTDSDEGRVVYATGETEDSAISEFNKRDSDTFKSSHWDEANVLAHVRLNDRVDADGKRVLFVEEIQSDWHQAGRKKGYREEKESRLADLIAQRDAAKEKRAKIVQEAESRGLSYIEAVAQDDAVAADTVAIEAQKEIDALGSGDVGVPDAPFRKTWHEFALKRIIRMAAEGGYDRVAWTTGEQQAERYDLSKQISRIEIRQDAAGLQELFAYDLNGEQVISQDITGEADLSEYIGKEAAEKLAAKKFGKENNEGFKKKTLKGLDLKVGGEGMKGFYDKILVDFANKFGKKYGAKVGETKLDAVADPNKNPEDHLTLEDRKILQQVADLDIGEGPGDITSEMILGSGGTKDLAKSWDKLTETPRFKRYADEWINEGSQEDQPGAKVHSLDITPQLRDVALNEGFSLFQSPMDRPLQTDVPMPESVQITTEDGALPDSKETRAQAASRFEGKAFTNQHTGWAIEIKRKGLKKASTTLASDGNKAALLNLDKLIESAVYARTEKDYSGHDNDLHIFYAPLRAGSKEYIAKIVVRESEGKRFYDKFVLEKETPTTSTLNQNQREAAGAAAAPEAQPTSINIDDFLRDVKSLQGQDPFFQPGDDSGARGQIRFGAGRQFSIDLLRNADLSTFLHETGHFYFEVMGDVASRPDAPQQIKDDYQTILNWMGIESRDQVEKKHHEMWARGFEAYLMEGKAPSSKLRAAFARLKVWLLSVYRQLRNLNVELTPEVRDVMNRMLATDEEINQVYSEEKIEPLFMDPKEVGMSDEQAERYVKARDEARRFAEDQVTKRLMRDHLRAQQAFYKKERSAIKAEIEAEANQMRIYRALSILQRGTLPDGSPLPEGMQAIKLDRKALVDAFGADFVKNRLPRPYVYSRDGGIHHDVAAELLGFESGDQLITAIVNSPSKTEYVNQLADQRMREKYPDLLTNGKLPEEALKAVHNEKRTQMLRMELQHLVSENFPVAKDVIRRVARRVPTEKAVRDQATKIVGSRRVGDIRPHQFLLAERKAAREAGEALAKGDIDAAFEAKRRELLNHELYRAAVEAREDVDASIKKFRKMRKSDEDLAKTRDVDMVNAARAVLAQFGLDRTNKTADQYLRQMQEYDPEAYETIKVLVDAASENAGPYRQVSYNDFVSMRDAVMALWDLSKTSREIEIDGQKLDREKIKEELSDRIQDLTKPGARAGYDRAVTKWDKVKMGLLGIKSSLRRVESWAEVIDGGRGPFTKYVVQPIAEAASRYRVAKKTAIERYLEMVRGIEKSLDQADIKAPEIGYTFKGKQELLGALLHTGNQSNFHKLLVGRGWGVADIEGNLDATQWNQFIARMQNEGVLTKADYDFVQGIWDMLEEFKPQAQRVHKQLYGFYFNEVTAQEVVTPFGTYRGGYMPAVADPFLSPDANIRNEREALLKNDNSFMFPTTGRGFTKSRVESYTAPLSIDLKLVPSHIDKVLRFVHIEPHAKSAGRLIMDKGFRRTLDAFDPTVAGDMLVPWLQRASQQRISTPTKGWGGKAFDTFWRELRTRTGLQVMALNVTNSLQQFTGLSIAALKVKPRHLRNALWGYVKAPRVISEDVTSKSDFMRTRMTTNVIEVQQTIDDLLLNPTKYEKARDFAKKHGYFLQSHTQNIVDTIVWSGAYDQAIEGGAVEIEAVRQADAAVRQTQGSFNAEDISRFETGTPFMRAFTMFYSYFNMQANLLGTEFTKVARDMGLRKGAGRALYIYVMGFMIPAVLSEVIVQALSGKGFDEDDDDQYLDDAFRIFFGSQARTASAMLPVAGPTVMAGINATNDKWYDDRISTSPSISMVESSVKAPVSVYKAINDKGSKSKAVKDSLTLLGLLTGVPLGALGRPAGYLIDVAEGEAEPEGPVDFTRGLVTGKRGEE